MNKIEAHWYSSNHRSLIERSDKVGCFYCKRIYKPFLIHEWIDDGETALCPYCGIDSVVPDFWGMVNPDMLKEMEAYWFNREAGPTYQMKDGKPVAVKEAGQTDFRTLTDEERVRGEIWL